MSRLTPVDLGVEVVAGLTQRFGRTLLTGLGTALGVAAFVAVLGLSATARGQVSERFTALAATEVTLERMSLGALDPVAFPQVGQDAVAALPGVREVGVSWTVPVGDDRVTARPGDRGDAIAVTAVTPGYLRAIHATMAAGVPLDRFHEERAERVVVLGRAAAARLGVSRVDAQPAVFIGAEPFTVVGIVDTVDRASDALLSVMVPSATASRVWGPPKSGTVTRMLVETDLGAAAQVGRQAPVAARPDSPELVRAVVPPDPHALHDQVTGDLDVLFLGLALVCLVIGTVSIANTSLVAILERVSEIGLRRALGARRRHIGAQFLLESAFLGLLGGLVGTAVGLVTVLVAALVQRWTPILDPLLVYPAPLLGTVTGIVGGLYPAWRATRVEPAAALRS
ncbi:ABC transporter permease [Actinokineospora enzanensis]|uniref:ABC transporter permease n=1 Tax=Actinokineospora enzanensis TaxID=155975 RepID=UPI000376776D|nr:ABC transporter permease [Actinokineospora enzanensis]